MSYLVMKKQRISSSRWAERFSFVVLLFLALGTCLLLAAIPAKAADVTFVEYGSNPVYDPPNPSDRAYYPNVLYDKNQFSSHGASYYYKMWYADGQGQFEAVTYSNDGISWSAPVQTTGILASGYHAKIIYIPGGYSAPGGIYYYKVWYWDSAVPNAPYTIDGIRTADSIDGENWANDTVITQDAGAQLVTGVWPDWNNGTYGPVSVRYNAAATNTGTNPFDYTFSMYYDATTGGLEAVGLGYSADGNTNWRIYGSAPVLDHGTPGSGEWDSDYASYGDVIKGSDGVWRWWYSGSGPSGGGNQGIGYATSMDGITWTKDPANPIFSIYQGVAWRNARCYTPSVLYSSTRFDGHGTAAAYKMWFTGEASATGNFTIGYAYADLGGAGVAGIPSLSEWSMILLSVLLALGAVFALRRRRQ
ncbi:MAG: IPTL-CTERM sorting domain-containing protein [Gallionellaceae bacterium]